MHIQEYCCVFLLFAFVICSRIAMMRSLFSLQGVLLCMSICFATDRQNGRGQDVTSINLQRQQEEKNQDLSVFIGIKATTAEEKYVHRARNILQTWGQDAQGYLALITDGINSQHNAHFQMEFPSLSIIQMAGTERFGLYHKVAQEKLNCSQTATECSNTAFASQRIKTRSYIKWITNALRPDAGVDWVCYVDDDMYVNVETLDSTLRAIAAAPPSTCQDPRKCVVADRGLFLTHKDLFYSVAVWCMRIPTLHAVAALLDAHSDEELQWNGPDDVGMAKVLKYYLNITITDSLTMLSINNRLVVSPKDKFVNPVGTYSLHKVNIRQRTEWTMTRKESPSDILARTSVLDLEHVNYTDLHFRHGAHKVEFSTNPHLKVDMKQWHAYVHPEPPRRKRLEQVLARPTSESYIEHYALYGSLVV